MEWTKKEWMRGMNGKLKENNEKVMTGKKLGRMKGNKRE